MKAQSVLLPFSLLSLVFLLTFVISEIQCVETKQSEYGKYPMYVEMGQPKVKATEAYGQRIHKTNRKPTVHNKNATYQYQHQNHEEAASAEVPSIELQLPYGAKNKNGRVPSKIMVRTFKTTTEAPYVPETHSTRRYTTERSTTFGTRRSTQPSTTTRRTVSTSTSTRRTPSTTRRVHPSTTTTRRATSKFTFPPYSQTTEVPSIPTTFYTTTRRLHISKQKQHKPTHGAKVKVTTTPEPTTVTTPSTEYTEEYTTSTETVPTETTSTTRKSTTTFATTPYSSKSRQLKVITKTFKPIYKTAPIVAELISTTTEKPVTPTKPKIHYIITVIGGSKDKDALNVSSSSSVIINATLPPLSNTSTTGNPSETEDATTPQEEIIYEDVEEDASSSTTTAKPDPYAHLETVIIPPYVDTSPPYDVIRSIGFRGGENFQTFPPSTNFESKQNFRYVNNFVNEAPSSIHYSNSQSQSHINLHSQQSRPIFSQSQRLTNVENQRPLQTSNNNNFNNNFQPQLIPLQTVVTYQPEPFGSNGNSGRIQNSNSNQKESPFFTAKSVLYYTQVSPKNQDSSNKIPSFSPNAISNDDSISSGSGSGGSRNQLLTGSSGNRISSPVAARSFYLENVGRLPVPSSVFGRPIPVLVNASPN